MTIPDPSSGIADRPADAEDVGRRFCDVVMKGGITSGVVFPSAIARLSRQYRFRNIGGTSAGAIAAAATAAAEFRRSTDALSPDAGFTRLGTLADWLGERPDGGPSRLFRLFRPEPSTRKHFAILGAMLNRGSVGERVLHAAGAAIRHFPLAAAGGALPGAVLIAAALGRQDALHALALALAVLVLVLGTATAAIVAAALSLARELPRHAFGLVHGHAPGDDPNSPPLIDWLDALLQDIAGKDARSPMTFGDLDGVVLDRAHDIMGINLEMMTTALDMGRPFSLPFATEQFYFAVDDMRRYFPAAIVDWMVAHPGTRSAVNHARDEAMRAFGYLPLPTRETLPVIVAVRLSLSFPFLLSAVPLYRYAWEASVRNDPEREDTTAQEGGASTMASGSGRSSFAPDDVTGAARERFVATNVRKVLFSDGGICSNFPVHLFDAVLPGWPTFGINLRDDLPENASAEARAYLPPRGKSLPPENYPIGAAGPAAVMSFATAIVRTMQNWRDNLQRAAPGFRDRVVTIRHTPSEGGLNLDMAPHDIEVMAASGALGAEQLVDGFGTPESLADDRFTYHRWVRARSLLNVLQRRLGEIHEGVTVIENHPPYPDLVRDAPLYVGGSYRLPESARVAAADLLDALDHLQHRLDAAHVEYGRAAPRPEVELRIQPVF